MNKLAVIILSLLFVLCCKGAIIVVRGPVVSAGMAPGASFDFDAMAIVANNDDTITTMVDSSGVTGNLTGSATYKTSAINGHPALYFAGSTSFNKASVDSTSLVGGGTFTMHLVLDSGATSGPMSYTANGNNSGMWCTYSGAIYWDFPEYATGRVSVSADLSSPAVVTFICNGTSRKIRVNGSQILNTTTGSYAPTGTGTLYVGHYQSAGSMSGNLGRCIIYPSVLSDAQIASNEAYLKGVFGTP